MQLPRKHHYLPKFILRRWAGDDGKLVEFQRHYCGLVKARRVHPTMTAYIENLYALRGFEAAEAQQIESLFLQPVDTQASEALNLLERRVGKSLWSNDMVSAWSRFLISLLIRMPEDVEVFRRKWRALFTQTTLDEERSYQQARKLDEPETLAALLSLQPEWYLEKATFESFISAHNSTKIGQFLNNMHWEVVDLSGSRHQLFLSDRPIIRTSAIAHQDGHIALPISPRLLFVAATRFETIVSIIDASPTVVVQECNAQIVGSAVRYCYSTTDQNLRYMQNRLGTVPQPRVMDRPVDYGEQRQQT